MYAPGLQSLAAESLGAAVARATRDGNHEEHGTRRPTLRRPVWNHWNQQSALCMTRGVGKPTRMRTRVRNDGYQRALECCNYVINVDLYFYTCNSECEIYKQFPDLVKFIGDKDSQKNGVSVGFLKNGFEILGLRDLVFIRFRVIGK